MNYLLMEPSGRHQEAAEDRAFTRFRQTGSPEDIAMVFDLTAPRLILVAVHLARDRHDAEDLLQVTFLEAIKRARAFEPGRPVLPWLMTILSRRASNKRRDRERRRETPGDGLEIPSGAPGPDDILERKEAVERIASAIEMLREPYREVLILNLAHGLRPVEIGRALNRPIGTVHTQLHRGLGLLRRALPTGLAVPAVLLSVSGHCLANIRVSVVAAASVARPLTPAAATGGVLMKKSLVGLVGLLVVGSLGLVWTRGPDVQARLGGTDPITNADVSAEGAEGEVSDSAGAREALVRSAAGRHEVEADITSPDSEPGALLFRVRWEDNGRAAQAVPVDVTARDGRDPLFATIRTATDELGEAGLLSLEPGRYSYAILGIVSRDVEVMAGRRTEVEHRLPSGVSVDVEVVHADGGPAAHAEVWVYRGVQFNDLPFPPEFDSGRRVARTDSSGRCHLRGLELSDERVEAGGSHVMRQETPWIGARLTGNAPSPLHSLSPSDRESNRTLTLRLGTGSAHATGLALGSLERPVVGALVELRPLPAMPQVQGSAFTLDRFPTSTRTDEQGRFSLQSRASDHVTLRVLAKGYAPYEANLELGPVGSVVPLTVQLVAGAAVCGRIRTKAGRPLARVRVSVAGRTVDSGHSGAFRVDALAAGRYECRFRAAGFREIGRVVDLANGSVETLDIVLEALVAISGHLVDADDERLVGWHVRADPVDERTQARVVTTASGDAGEFSLDVAAGCEYVLSVREPETIGLIEFPELGPVVGDREPLTLAVRNESRTTSFLEGYLVGLDGEPLVGQVRIGLERAVHRWAPPFEYDEQTGHIVIGPIPPGESGLSISSTERRFPAFRSGPHRLRPHERKALGRLVPPPIGVLEVHVRPAAGADVEGSYVDVIPQEGTPPSARRQHRVEVGSLDVTMEVQLGRYKVRLWGDGVQPIEKAVEVTDQRTATVELQPNAGRRRAIMVALPEGEQEADVSIRAASDEIVWQGSLASEAPTVRREIVFGIGPYVVEAVGGSGRRYVGEVIITDLEDQTTLSPLLRLVR